MYVMFRYLDYYDPIRKKKQSFIIILPPSIITITLNICSCIVVAATFPKPTLVRDDTMKYKDAMYRSPRFSLMIVCFAFGGGFVLLLLVILLMRFEVIFCTMLLHMQAPWDAGDVGGYRSSLSRLTQLSSKCSSVVEIQFHRQANQ